MGNDELHQYGMLVADLRGRLQAKVDELLEAEQSINESPDLLPEPWIYKGCKGN